jgi:hypothetical protein
MSTNDKPKAREFWISNDSNESFEVTEHINHAHWSMWFTEEPILVREVLPEPTSEEIEKEARARARMVTMCCDPRDEAEAFFISGCEWALERMRGEE